MVSNTVAITVNASDNVGVIKVECYLDGTLAGSSTADPAGFSWNTTNSPNGAHTLEAKAYDAAGNIGASSTVNVTVQNPVPVTTAPTVQITSPVNGTAITQKTTQVCVAAGDGVGVTKASLTVDGKLYATMSNNSPTTSWKPVFSWNTGKLGRGSHTLQATAYDAAGNSARSAVVTVKK